MGTKIDRQDFLIETERLIQEVMDHLDTSKTEPTLQGVALRIKRHLIQDLRYLATLTGNATAIDAAGEHGMPPTDLLHPDRETKIMGKSVGAGNQPVREGTLSVSQKAKEKFSANVNDLFNGFLGLKDKDLEDILAKTGGDTLLRGVAKKAGVDNWETINSADMGSEFFADIREAIKDKAKKATTAFNAAGTLDEVDEANDTKVAPKKAAPAKKATASKKVATHKADADEEDDDSFKPAAKRVAPKKAAPAKKSVLDDEDD